ncbi:hypothetical protein SEA_JOLENE_37 [Mycobacterium phage Jolene]|uniref:Uncharacterized protein n=3 Tax=Liefievirus TaxID=1623288 RepID=Q1A0P2_9CAUD|nr:hypothetical protein M695_gp36 [Mycobacterium phage Leo]YP_009013766.1 hypothetical protein CL64_gp37 [Mycobacterium phage Liefie]YP_655554.1 hypothetical protein Halo37 [Mycobacterium phage Halo]ACB58196.1 hypothetical protein BPs1_37 [Mycobacterium phage BPs]ACU41501.1 hypothetical protein HOPE_37 [Mycobacterium phage Hope]AER48492.1 hypothetical protein AVRAFAN_37 [Mycobacterium phage Avrafan]AGK85882.1 hypothetical protein Chy2_0036 [Mycobacterium phage Chy2]AGK85941.1 hypothetical pr
MRALFHRGRHRANKFSHTVADVKRCLDAEKTAVAEHEEHRQHVADLVLAGRWAEVWGTNR